MGLFWMGNGICDGVLVMCEHHMGLVWVAHGSETPYSEAMCLESRVPAPDAFPTSAAQLSSAVAHSAPPALLAASLLLCGAKQPLFVRPNPRRPH